MKDRERVLKLINFPVKLLIKYLLSRISNLITILQRMSVAVVLHPSQLILWS